MSRQLRAFVGGQDRKILAPMLKRGGVWEPASKVFRKEAGEWVEWWPLLPLPPLNVTGNFLYRNDNIELDIDWDEPVGPEVSSYRVDVVIAGETVGSYTQVGNATLTPPRAWQQYAGSKVRIGVTGITPFGEPGETGWSPQYTVPQLPPPPDPSNLAVTITNRRAVATWLHTGGNRLAMFELRTSYQNGLSATVAGKTVRSSDVTFWSTVETPGDPGGSVGVLIRAVGPGGFSNWIDTSGTVPNVPNPPPTVAKILPGTPVISNHRFLSGTLRCTYSAPNAVGVRVRWERFGGTGASLASVSGGTGTVTIPASTSWARDDINRYRIVLRGYNASGEEGPAAYGPWARKLPNPYTLTPNDFISMRGQYPDGEYYPFSPGYLMGLNLRQGSSYNVFAYLKPIIVWRGYVGYDEGLLSPARVGYTPTVTSAQVWMQRSTSGGLGSSVRPRLWWHGYESLKSPGPGTSLINGRDLAPLARGQAAWLDVDVAYARKMINPADPIKGIALYHPNSVLLGYLGDVSAEYMILNGPFATPFGVSCFSMRLYHDG
jgi:hypothetical protein